MLVFENGEISNCETENTSTVRHNFFKRYFDGNIFSICNVFATFYANHPFNIFSGIQEFFTKTQNINFFPCSLSQELYTKATFQSHGL